MELLDINDVTFYALIFAVAINIKNMHSEVNSLLFYQPFYLIKCIFFLMKIEKNEL